MTRELAEEFKKACEEQDCETCPFSVGIYMEGPDYVYYSCDIRKKPRDWDIAKERVKQTKFSKKDAEKASKKAEKEKKAATLEAKRNKRKEKEEKKAAKKKEDKPVEVKEKKKRGRPKKSESMIKDSKGQAVLF